MFIKVFWLWILAFFSGNVDNTDLFEACTARVFCYFWIDAGWYWRFLCLEKIKRNVLFYMSVTEKNAILMFFVTVCGDLYGTTYGTTEKGTP